jgi:twitching motility protein PilT
MNVQGASDLHISSGNVPALRIKGELHRIKYKEMEDNELREMLYEICPEHKVKVFEEKGDIDFAYELPSVGRFRSNYFRQAHGISAVFRQIPSEIMTIEQLGLPVVTKRMANLPKGLVLVTGPTGSGKSTSLAAIIDYANKTRRGHIITVEDPIEFIHKSYNCIINHREVGRDTLSFSAALRGALREDPNIIMVGEMRDLETISLAVEAASTGHLVFATLHTQDACKTVNRVIEVFPAEVQEQMRNTLSDSLRAVISQALFKRKDKKGRIAALEILVHTPAVGSLIREAKTQQLINVIQTGKRLGMCTMDDSIEALVNDNLIEAEDAFEKASDKARFVKYLKEIPEEYKELFENQEATNNPQ